MASQKQWEALQARWRAAIQKVRDLGYKLDSQYGKWYIYAPTGKREAMERAQKAEDRAMESVFAWLDAHSPRAWRTGAPAHWICGELSYADAITSGQLSVVPPCSYGSYPADMVRFAGPVQTNLTCESA